MINNEQYNELVQKLAEEIVEGAIENIAYEEDEGMETTAGVKDVFKEYMNIVSGKNVKAAKHIVNKMKRLTKDENSQYLAKKLLRKERLKRAGALGATIGAGIGAGATIKGLHGAYKSRKDAVAEKAASVYEEAQFMKEAAYQAMAEAEAQYQAALEVLAEAEMYEEATYKVAEELDLI